MRLIYYSLTMATNNTIVLFILLLFWLLFSGATCTKESACKEIKHQFRGSFKVSPDIDSIRIGDTIFLESRIPYILTDQLTNEIVEFKNASNISVSVSIDKLLAGNNSIGCVNCFELKPMPGTSIPMNISPDRNTHYAFVKTDTGYHLKLAIIPKQIGSFCIGTSDAGDAYPDGDRCRKALFHFRFENTNQHLYLYLQTRPGYTPSQYEIDHLYCFKVY